MNFSQKNDLNRKLNACTKQTGLKIKRVKSLLIFVFLCSHFSFYYPEENTKDLVAISSYDIFLSSKSSCQHPSLSVSWFSECWSVIFFSLKPQLPFMSAATVMSEVKVTLSGKGYYLCIDSQRDIALDEKKEIWKNLQNFPETQFMFLIVYPSF